MDKLRYLLFLPAALFASMICGAVGNWLGNFGIWVLSGSEVLGWVFSGIASSVFFMNVGMQVAPQKTNKIKWILLSVLLLLGGLSAIGSFFFGDSLAYIAGVIMVVSAFIYSRLEPKEMVF